MGKKIHKAIGVVIFIGCEILTAILFGVRGLLLVIATSCIAATLTMLLIDDEQSPERGDGDGNLDDDDTTEGR